MKAVIKLDNRPECLVQEVEIPKPKDEEALIKIGAAGLCGTDVAIRNNTFMGRHGEIKVPLIPGHEFCGKVVEVGSRVSQCRRPSNHQCHQRVRKVLPLQDRFV